MSNTQATATGNEIGTGHVNPHEGRFWKPHLAFLLFAITISLAGGFVFQRYKESIKKDKQNELAGIAELKIKQINGWITDRKGDAQALANDPLFLPEVERWLQRGAPSDETKARLTERLASLQRAYAEYGYLSISVFDANAKWHLSSLRNDRPLPKHEKTAMLESMRSGQIVLSDIHSSITEAKQVIELDLVAPLFVGKEGGRHVIGAVLFHIDPYRFLFPLLRRWPTPSPSAENLLVRRDGDEVVFLNELRHRNNPALSLHLPLSNSELPTAMAALGREGMVEGLDYRGVPVVGMLHKVPGTSWTMVSKIDKSEIYAPINSLGNLVLLLLLLLIGAGGGVTVFWWKQQRQYIRALQQQHMQELEHQALTRHLDYITKYSNDIIMLADDTGKIIDFNDRALEAYGYSAQEFSRLSIFDLRQAEFTYQVEENFKKLHELGALRFEAVHIRKNGEKFPVETSVRVVEIAGKSFQQAITRDITERKKAEEELTRQKSFIRQVIDSDPNLIFVKDSTGKYLLANEAMAKSNGLTTENIVGKYNWELTDNPEYVDSYDRANHAVLETRQEYVSLEMAKLADGQRRFFHTIRKPLLQDDDSISVLTIATDITELKEAQLRFENEHTRLRTLVQTIPELIWLKDTDGIYLECNPQFERYFGAKEADIVGKTDYDFVDSKLADHFRQKDREATIADKPCVNEEWVTYPDNDQRRLLETIKTPMRDEAGKLIGVMGIARDITERKRNEEELRFKNTLLMTEHEASIEGILIVDVDGSVISYNQRFAGICGISEDIVGAGSGERALQSIAGQLAEPERFLEKVRYLYQHYGETSRDEVELSDNRVFEYYTTPMTGPQDEYYGRIWYFRDLTEQKFAAKDLAKSYVKLQRLSLRMDNARADERAKIALNLHDEMGATLAAMKMRVAWLASKLPAEMPQLLEETVHISELVSDGIQTMHHIVGQLKSDMLSDAGLAAAIADYVKKFRKHTNIECVLVQPETEFKLNADQSLTLFRILQETLNNVVKHAQASKVSIVFTERDNSLLMVVKDDGIGFDTDMHKEQSFGLLGIRERALMVGGKARISSTPKSGTRISVSIPYPTRRIGDLELHHA